MRRFLNRTTLFVASSIFLTFVILGYFISNIDVSDTGSAETEKEEDNQLSVLGANSLKFAAPSASALSATQLSQPSLGPVAPTKKPTPTPNATATASSSATPSPTPSVSPTPTPTSTPTATPTSTPTPSPTATPTATPSPTPDSSET